MDSFPELDFQRTPVTLIIAAVAIALEVGGSIDEGRRLFLYNDALGILPSIWGGQVWRPFTTTLMHANLLHALFNTYWWVHLGSALEKRLGSNLFFGLVLFLGYTTMIPEFLVDTFHADSPPMIVGLSGTLYGLVGILLIGRRRDRELEFSVDSSQLQFLLFWLVLCIPLTYFRVMPVANIAHFCGLGFGLLYGQAIFSRQRRALWIAVATVATLLVLSSMLGCPWHPFYQRYLVARALGQG
jgi:membrane associated rhomboid family serine protease